MPEQGSGAQEHRPCAERGCVPSPSPWVTCSFRELACDVAGSPPGKGPGRPRLCWPQFLPPVHRRVIPVGLEDTGSFRQGLLVG